MKRTIIALLALGIGSSYAMEGKGFNISNKKMSCSFAECRMEHRDTAVKFKTSSSSETTVPPATGKVKKYAIIESFHNVYVYNNTHKPIMFEISVRIECDTGKSATRSFDVTIQPGGYYIDTLYNSAKTIAENTGHYRIWATTQIQGEKPYTDSYGKNILTITR